MKEIYFAGGCFWGIEEFFSRIYGVAETNVGYANSKMPNPSYELVCSGVTNAAECVCVRYDESEISLQNLIAKFFSIIDARALNRQGNDFGTQYRSGIYYVDSKDLCVIEDFVANFERECGFKVATEVCALQNYYLAENYHQKYLKKNPHGYCHIKLD